ncbi:hypothetical protein A4K93_00495 [Salmonella enterica subsp. enterica serovar Schwarzengrund]|uniref:Uncharacterized protein n=2 Tax=root TaxID=1 RepID=A0A5W3ERQ6_SALET|nr:hypothetical protein [Salmonella enterica]EBR0312030.1 hypothetical protein [Salmonella enterica subsp. enterica serovar Virchow]EBU9529946.1 hypothetical protein [Salmonella enterica subsp. enterica serovar Haifa]EBW2509545.1 hypothetical protein [Salmonella enterica subsp. enterica serovar Enteritidis]EBW6073539.1 hypothetical protein [Salmonella enterica subsp. enterica serovar Schwarzengrund]WNT48521.1 hypothetical protein SPLA5c_PHROGS00029 [Salmonella phage SPLA5c]VFR10502.1 hypothet
MYRNSGKSTEMITAIRRDLEERGCVDIELHQAGETVHITALDAKRKRSITVWGKPYASDFTETIKY